MAFHNFTAERPQKRNGGTCLYSEVCCSSAYEQQIGNKTDTLTTTLTNFFSGSMPGGCSSVTEALACIACAPDQATYLTPIASVFQFKLCPSYCDTCVWGRSENWCDRMYASCGSATVRSSGRSVKDTFPSSVAFCSKLFYDVANIVPSIPKRDDHACFSPNLPGLSLLILALTLVACTSDDIEFIYTDCIAGKTDLHYVWNNDGCTAGVSLPPAKTGLTCRKLLHRYPLTSSSSYFLHSRIIPPSWWDSVFQMPFWYFFPRRWTQNYDLWSITNEICGLFHLVWEFYHFRKEAHERVFRVCIVNP